MFHGAAQELMGSRHAAPIVEAMQREASGSQPEWIGIRLGQQPGARRGLRPAPTCDSRDGCYADPLPVGAGQAVTVEKVIIALAIATGAFLYWGMHTSLTAPDPTRPPSTLDIQQEIALRGGACDNVISSRLIGTWNDWTYYFARCQDGGRYVYMHSPKLKRVSAISCDKALQRGYTCPKW